ncbi:translation initiation factor IF-2 [Candidatus Bipolaricaulota bacterium]|nr:translation initiation factor IF-2 [Candidatus Bipolaricaulota bacterium]
MSRKRIYEIAKELGISSKDLIAALSDLGMTDLKAANSVEDDEVALIIQLYRDKSAVASGAEKASTESDDSSAGDAPPPPSKSAPSSPKKKSASGSGSNRPPIVSVLGHIDHGKTTLLDAIRKSHLASHEAGGITQGVAAYQADLNGRKITFIDTPGHKAFTGMRARGASATDIAILVVAADDGVMAQTVEAIDHIRAAGIPMIVAVNKIDKANADQDKVLNDLVKHGLVPEAWGGDTIAVPISALTGENLEELMEMILLVAEMEELQGDPNGKLEGVVIESHLSTSRGPVASVVVRNGTLHEKDFIVAGATYGRIKAMNDEMRNRLTEVLPGEAAEIIGLQDVPEVGTAIEAVDKQADAKRLSQKNRLDVMKPRRAQPQLTLEDLFGENVEEAKLVLVLKAASTGALEAARREVEAIGVEGVEVSFIHAGVGSITESDILLAATVPENCLVVGFGVRADANAARLADRQGVTVQTYDIIYELLDEIERSIKRLLAPVYEEIRVGEAEVRELFKVPTGVVAGCQVVEGKAMRSAHVRVLRGKDDLFTGEVASLRRFEDDVREVQVGRDCGIRIKDFDDVAVGDHIVFFTLEEVDR